MKKRKKTPLMIAFGGIVIFLGFLVWFLIGLFEGEKPVIGISPLPEYISEPQEFSLSLKDSKRGLRNLDILVNQEGREVNMISKKFGFKGLLNREGIRDFQTVFVLDPNKLRLAQGQVILEIRVRDYSRRNGGDGNLSLIRHKVVIDTIPPALRALSRMHNVNLGGTGLVVYQTSLDTVNSGVFVDDLFFKGFPAGKSSPQQLFICYFAVPQNTEGHPEMMLWASDRAGNLSKAPFYYHIRRKLFNTSKINITDRFLKKIAEEFSYYPFDLNETDINKFLKVNQEMRKENNLTFYGLKDNVTPRQLWDGRWLRLKDAATMAKFGERRLYYYRGEKVDEQTHLGTDLASIANSEVQGANHGKVIFSGPLGIYGNTVVLDHGQGLASVYSHLSEISVKSGQEVGKGEVIGITGQTGLAGGDHLHFGVMVNGVFVDPIEWWDSHWIRDNISNKLDMIDQE